MSLPYEPHPQELEMATGRLDYLDAALRAAERRAEVPASLETRETPMLREGLLPNFWRSRSSERKT